MKSLFRILVLFLAMIGMNHPSFSQSFPVSGTGAVELSLFEEKLIEFIRQWNLAGGQVAVCKDGRLVYSRAFGYADREDSIPVNTENLFRIASSSKPITAVAVMKLIEEGKLSLGDKAFSILSNLKPLPTATIDPRLYEVTVEMLLEHLGGWTLAKGDRQVIYLRKAADAFGLPRPASAETIIRYSMGDKLEFDPGTEYCYSNFGYNILGRIIEKVSGKSYEQFVMDEVLKPAGVNNMTLAKTRAIYRKPGEVNYYTEDQEPYWSVLDEEEMQVTTAYGGDYFIEVMDSHGGWIANAESLAKFVTSVDTKTNRPHILSDSTVGIMLSEPLLKPVAGATEYYAKGWDYEPATDTWSHAGALAGCSSYLLRFGNGVTVTAVFNGLPMSKIGEYIVGLKNDVIREGLKSVTIWPEGDLFK